MSALLDQLDAADVSVPTGRRYGSAEPVVVRVRRRADKLTIDDSGTAVRLAGRPAGWLARAERIAEQGLNVNRRGVVFVPLAGGDPAQRLDRLIALVAEASLSVYDALLDDEH